MPLPNRPRDLCHAPPAKPRACHAALLAACLACLVAGGGCKEEKRAEATTEARSAAAEAAPLASGPKVVFLGDSISAGIHLAADEAFPAVLERKLRARGKPFQLINAGVSGDTTAGGLRRLDWLLQQAPAIVVVELGANDAMRGIAPSEVDKNLRAIVERIRATGATPLLLGMRIPTSYGPDHAGAFAKVYERIADDLDLAFIPFFMEGVAAVAALNLQDGIHPTAKGHEKLAQNVEDALGELIDDVK